jgi:GrpB-like predicted nucleotidyltransferase (UPF0157 family)
MSGVTHDRKGWSNADQDRVELVAYDPELAGVSADQSAWPALIEPIKALGYVFWADNPRRDRLFFVKGMPPFGPRRTHHVHVRTPEDARTALLFCEHLRRHPEEAARYAALKRELSARYPTDRDAYTEGKVRYVDDIVRKAGTP